MIPAASSWPLALLVALSLGACSASAPPAATPPRPTTDTKVSPQLLVPPPALHRFGTFAEDEGVQLFALEGTPLLRVGARLYSLLSHEAKREPALEKALFDAAGKPWWRVLGGSRSGALYADRIVPGATPSDPTGVEIVRVSEQGAVALGRVVTKYPTVQRLVPLPDGRVLVTVTTPEGGMDGNEVSVSEIVPRAPGDETVLDPRAFHGQAWRSPDGSVVLASRDADGKEISLLTWRRGATAPTVTPTSGLPDGWPHLFATEDGALHANLHGTEDVYALEGSTWVKVDPSAKGAAAETRRRHLQRARPDGSAPVRLTLEGRHLEVAAFGFARDPGGGVWALGASGLGLFHDQAPARLVELGPDRKPSKAIATILPPATPATAPDPGAPLIEVLDATRYLEASEGSLAIRPLAGRTFVTIDDQILIIDGDTLKSDPALQRGLGDRSRFSPGLGEVIGAMGGHFPEAAWIQITYRAERSQFAKLLRWGGAGWEETFAAGGSGIAVNLEPLANGWSVLEETPAFAMGAYTFLSLLHGNVAHQVVGGGLPGLGGANTRAIATLPDGTLYVALPDAVAAWSPDGKPLPLAPLPPVTAPLDIIAMSASEVFVIVDPAEGAGPSAERQLLRFDGKAWSPEVLPEGRAAPLQQLFAGPRGSLWVTLEEASEVLVRSPSGAWSTMRAPAHLDSVWTGPAGDVWAVAGPKLLHTKPLPRGFDLAAVLPPRGIEQWGPPCPTVSVLVHDVPKTAPAKVSFAETIELLGPSLGALAKEAAYYEIVSAGKRSFVVHLESAPSGEEGLAGAKALMTAAEAKIPGAKPRLVCLGSLEERALPRGVQSIRAVGGTADPGAVFK